MTTPPKSISGLTSAAAARVMLWQSGQAVTVPGNAMGLQLSDPFLTSIAGQAWVNGDILYADGTDDAARLPIGSEGQVLKVVGGVPTWIDPGWELIAKGYSGAYVASVNFTNLSAYRWIRINMRANPQTNNHSIGVRVSTNNGSSYIAGTSYDYQNTGWSLVTGSTGGAAAAVSGFFFNAVTGVNNGSWIMGSAVMGGFNTADHLYWHAESFFIDGSAGNPYSAFTGGRLAQTTARDALQLTTLNGGNLQAYYVIEGIRS